MQLRRCLIVLGTLLGSISWVHSRHDEEVYAGGEYISPEILHPGDYTHSAEIRDDGSVWVVGRNDYGQLGDGTRIHRGTPSRVKSAIKMVPGLPVMLKALTQRPQAEYDVLDGPAANMVEYSYETDTWLVRMRDYGDTSLGANVKLLIATPEQLDGGGNSLDIPEASTMKPQGSRRRSGCRASDVDKTKVWIFYDDGSRQEIIEPQDTTCIRDATVFPAETIRQYLPRHYGNPDRGYGVSGNTSKGACTIVPKCDACNTYDEDEECPNDEFACNFGGWEHGRCRLRYEPGLQVLTRLITLTPQIELNNRFGETVGVDYRYGVEWEVKITPFTCDSGSCNSGNVLSVSVPVHSIQIDGEAYEVATGAFHTVFLWKDGAVWTTGLNSEGQLGDGTRTTRSFPKFVQWSVRDVGAGHYHSIFLLKNGTAMATGRNTEGQLGDGSFASKTTAVRVIDGMKQVSAGAYHSVFLKEDGTAWAAGMNNYGQLGDYTTYLRGTPVKVFSGITSVAAGDYYSLFVMWDPVLEVNTLYAAGLFDPGLERDRSDWSLVTFYNESQVQRMTLKF